MGIEQQRLEDAKMADAKHADCKENRSAITSRNCQVLELASPDGNDGAFKRIGPRPRFSADHSWKAQELQSAAPGGFVDSEYFDPK